MQGVPKDLYEAVIAAWRVSGVLDFIKEHLLAHITPAIITMALLSAIWTFNSFEIIWILPEGGPRGATTTLIIDT